MTTDQAKKAYKQYNRLEIAKYSILPVFLVITSVSAITAGIINDVKILTHYVPITVGFGAACFLTLSLLSKKNYAPIYKIQEDYEKKLQKCVSSNRFKVNSTISGDLELIFKLENYLLCVVDKGQNEPLEIKKITFDGKDIENDPLIEIYTGVIEYVVDEIKKSHKDKNKDFFTHVSSLATQKNQEDQNKKHIKAGNLS